eukprot:CAMPEP_0178392648 /NCGR_PEP_ID=MMETSP0689_2-20121128/11785_1 /TAXON_ID=160604 /ORGANISM="Amphidinium massartii, Strain CS-259" /LENGTH=723 /DNA_ID=CAMNT_0020013225 /DNA_START=37 /DNA_END=2205 /DNA_ORIENTATION=-
MVVQESPESSATTPAGDPSPSRRRSPGGVLVAQAQRLRKGSWQGRDSIASQSDGAVQHGGEDEAASGSLLALLLNTETKDEGEEFLDFSYPSGSDELKAVLPMKGVLLASAGIMMTTTGMEVQLMVFRGADGKDGHYKVAFQRIERWLLCIVVPGGTSDAIARFLAEEASALVALRHGGLRPVMEAVQQLEPIFKALSNLLRIALQSAADGELSSRLLYAYLGVVVWHPTLENWKEQALDRVAAWEHQWEDASRTRPPLAMPEGFALFLDHALVGTSLQDLAFEACLRVCFLEGIWEQGPGDERDSSGSNCGTRCRSMFLTTCSGDAADELPSHQYTIGWRGPWVLVLLWKMAVVTSAPQESMSQAASAAVTPSKQQPEKVGFVPPPRCMATPLLASSPQPSLLAKSSQPFPAAALRQPSESQEDAAADPFGVDLCASLLGGMPLLGVSMQTPISTAASTPGLPPRGDSASSAMMATRSGSPPGPSKTKRKGRQLACLWRQFSGQKSTRQRGLESSSSFKDRPQSFVHALELQALPPTAHFGHFVPKLEQMQMRTPRCAVRDCFDDALRLRCPEQREDVALRRSSDWNLGVALPSLEQLRDLDFFTKVHSNRRHGWTKLPNSTICRHVLQNTLKGGLTLDVLWDECFAEVVGEQTKSEASNSGRVKLGNGDAWRFQAGAQIPLSDLPPFVGAGALLGESSGRQVWATISTVWPSRSLGTASTN